MGRSFALRAGGRGRHSGQAIRMRNVVWEQNQEGAGVHSLPALLAYHLDAHLPDSATCWFGMESSAKCSSSNGIGTAHIQRVLCTPPAIYSVPTPSVLWVCSSTPSPPSGARRVCAASTAAGQPTPSRWCRRTQYGGLVSAPALAPSPAAVVTHPGGQQEAGWSSQKELALGQDGPGLHPLLKAAPELRGKEAFLTSRCRALAQVCDVRDHQEAAGGQEGQDRHMRVVHCSTMSNGDLNGEGAQQQRWLGGNPVQLISSFSS